MEGKAPVKFCGCLADKHGNPNAANYQDSVLGKGMRYHSQKKPNPPKPQEYRCGVCGTVRS